MKKPPDSWTAQSDEREASMNNTNILSHSKWECKYHVVWIPKCGRKPLYGLLRKNLGEVLHDVSET